MSSKRFEKGSLEFSMFGEFWKLCQKHWIIENKDKYFDDLINDCEKFAKDFSGTKMSKHLALALLNFVDESEKEKYGG
jgi:hypothetical protein